MTKEEQAVKYMVDVMKLKEKRTRMNEREDEICTEIDILNKIIKRNKREWEILTMDRMSLCSKIDDLEKFFDANPKYKKMLEEMEEEDED